MLTRTGVLIIILMLSGWAPCGEWTGFVKNFSLVADPPGTVPVDRLSSSTTRLRIQYQGWMANDWSVETAMEWGGALQHHLLFAGGVFQEIGGGAGMYRFSDPDSLWYPDSPDRHDNVGLYFNLDRLRLVWQHGGLEVSVGRQAVSWGSAKVINPTDILAPFAFTELDTEYRAGVDAVRFRYALGALGELDAGYVMGAGGDMSRSALYVRGKGYWAMTDVSGLVMRFGNNLMLGVDMTRAIGGTGVWMEAAYVDADHFLPVETDGDYFRVSLGADRQLTPRLYGYVEYHFNGAGNAGSTGYPVLSPAALSGGVYLTGRHYGSIGFGYQLTPLTMLNGMVMQNLSDHSAFVSLSAEWNLRENLYLSGGVYIAAGNSPFDGSAGDPFPTKPDEFGAYPDLLYVSLRWYF